VPSAKVDGTSSVEVLVIEILYEDASVVVCIKSHGTVSESIDGSSISLPNIIMKERGYKELYTVHRLDKDVGGLIVYAQNATAAAELSKQILDGTLKKEYVATVEGKFEEHHKKLIDLLYFDRKKNKSYVVDRERHGVKRAELNCELISYDKENDLSTVKIELITGRTHQIRVQFASRKHPVLGDKKYGSKHSVKPIRLYSSSLSFVSPATSETVNINSTPDWN